MAQLAEGAARDHPSNFRKAAVRTNAARGGGSSQPQASAGVFDARCQRAIIDHLLPNGRNSAGLLERCRAYENASSSRARGAAPGIGDPRGRIKFEEKIDKRRNQKLLRQ